MQLLWAVIFFPLLGAILNGLVFRKDDTSKALSHVLGSGALVASFLCAVALYFSKVWGQPEAYIQFGLHWIEAGDFRAPFQFILDPLSGLMMLIITGIGSLIHIYAGGYMHGEKNTWRFFSYLNLFIFMMLLLVLGDNLLVMFIGWEGVGLCSYLLIGYWYEELDNATAGMKAFLVNRIGDIGFLIGIFLTYKFFGTISFSELKEMIMVGQGITPIHIHAIGWITLALFIGACGKSAQIPLYTWLPDAMAGPTPVSALIHAATMVTAGIYMMTRMSFFFYLAPDTQMIVAAVGGWTALFAATIAIVQTDIKKVLAYSTVSQLGYMVMGCGLGAYSAGVFHLFTHACFKALLFMGAGSVIVAMHHKQDMKVMGGLRKYMPWTNAVMFCGVLAIIGFPFTSGFFSKDEILWKAWTSGFHLVWILGVAAAVCTSFYMVRLYAMTFLGENRSDKHTKEHLHETSIVMWGPLVILAFLSLVVGFLNVPHWLPGVPHLAFEHYLASVTTIPEIATSMNVADWGYLTAHHSIGEEVGIMLVAVIPGLIAALIAWRMYRNGPSMTTLGLAAKFRPLHKLLSHKYYVDEFYNSAFVQPLKDMSFFLWKIIDTKVVDGIVNGVGQACMVIGGLASFRMTGSIHRHATVLVLGLVCILTAMLFVS